MLFSGSHHVPGGSDGDGPAHRVFLDGSGELHVGGALHQFYIYLLSVLLLLFSGSHHVPGGSDGDGPAHRVLLDGSGELHAGGALYQLYIYILSVVVVVLFRLTPCTRWV